MEPAEQNTLTARFQALLDDFQALDSTRKSLLKRAVTPSDLLEQPAFYGLYRKHLKSLEERSQLLRLIYCLPFISHRAEGRTLGASLAASSKEGRAKIGEKRVIQLARTENSAQGMVTLRRLLKQAEPEMDWLKAASSLWFWGERSRRQLLEDYFMALPADKVNNR